MILLNSDYSFLNTIHWKKAMRLLAKGKVEVLKSTSRVIRNSERTWKILVPKIIRLVKLVRSIWKTRVPFSKKNVLYRDGYTCQYCGIKLNKLTLDHVIPKSRGGRGTFENCVASCRPCNNTKGDRTPNEAKMGLKRTPFQPTIMEFITIRMKLLGIDELLEDLWKS